MNNARSVAVPAKCPRSRVVGSFTQSVLENMVASTNGLATYQHARAPPTAFRRSKVDSSLASCPGGASDRELSGAGRRADLYSGFGVQRNLRDLRSSKGKQNFSAASPGLRTANYAAKFDKIGALLVTSLKIKTSWRREVNSNSDRCHSLPTSCVCLSVCRVVSFPPSYEVTSEPPVIGWPARESRAD